MSILLAGTVFIPVTMIVVGFTHFNDCPAENIPFFLLIGGLVWFVRNMTNLFSKCSSASEAASIHLTQRSSSGATISGGRSRSSSTSRLHTRSNRRPTSIVRSSCSFDCELGTEETEPNITQSGDFEHRSQTANAYRTSTSSNTGCGSTCAGTAAAISAHPPTLLTTGRSSTANGSSADRPTHAARRRLAMLHTFWLIWFVVGCVMVYRIFPPEYHDASKPNYCDQTVYLFAFWLVTSVFIIFGLFVSCLCCVSIAALFSTPAARQRLSSGT